MSDLVCIAYPEETKAERLLQHLEGLPLERPLDPADAAVVVTKADGRILIGHTALLSSWGHVSGGLVAEWPHLVRVLLLHPDAGLLSHATTAARTAAETLCRDMIAAAFFKGLHRSVRPGGSALFLLVDSPELGRALEEATASGEHAGQVVRAALTPAATAALQARFGTGSPPPDCGEEAPSRNPVDRASDDGFPASDPPSFVAGRPGRTA